jgi:hypothetical protein
MQSPNRCCLHGTNVPRYARRNANALGLQRLQLPDVAVSSSPPCRTRIIHYRTDELFAKPHIVSDRQAASPVNEGAKLARSLICLFSYLPGVCRPGQLCIKGHPKFPCFFNPLTWLSEKMDCAGLLDASRSLDNAQSGAPLALMAILQSHGKC